ncbi:unnamed protein product [Diplocarpon coronariae]
MPQPSMQIGEVRSDRPQIRLEVLDDCDARAGSNRKEKKRREEKKRRREEEKKREEEGGGEEEE